MEFAYGERLVSGPRFYPRLRRCTNVEFEFDASGLSTSVRDAMGISQIFAYDAAGQGISKTDELGHTSHFAYDVVRRLIQTEYADGTKVSSSFDARGQLISRTDQLNRTTHYEHDGPVHGADLFAQTVNENLGGTVPGD